MVNAFQAISLSTLLADYVLYVIIIGVLSYQLITHDKGKYKIGLVGFFILTIIIAIFTVAETYRNFVGPILNIYNVLLLISRFIGFGIFLFSSIKSWKFINNKLFFSVLFFAVLFVFFELVLKNPDILFVLNAIVGLTASIMYYLLIINFIININIGKK